MQTEVKSVSRGNPCPVCEGNQRCSVGADGVVFCRGADADGNGFKCFGKTQGDEGCSIFRRIDDSPLSKAEPIQATAKFSGIESQIWRERSDEFAAALTLELRDELARNLKLPIWAVEEFDGLGAKADEACWTISERDGSGKVVGVNRRFQDGRKQMIVGSKRGLIYSPNWDRGGPICLVEGASDYLAMAAMGLSPDYSRS